MLLAASLANDWPNTREGIVERTREFGMTMKFPASPEDHAATRRVIDDWLEVVRAPDSNHRAALLNAQMAAATGYPRLTDHDGERWHLHYRDDDQALPAELRAVVGTSLHLVTRGMHRLSICAAAPCGAVVVDVTRNGRQRYCSVRCANRAAVRRHRSKVVPGRA